MLVTFEKWHDAIKFLTEGIPGASLSPRDVRLLSLHLEKHQLTVGDARMVLARIGWYVKCLILVSAILFAIGISLLALSAVLLAMKIVLWIIMVLFRALYILTAWLLKEPVQVQVNAQVRVSEEVAFTLTQNKDGTWVFK
jgi:hypothetical protein